MLADILETLYSDDSDIYDIIDILNESRYITDIEDPGSLWLFNTGFRFNMHTGKYMDLYFDLKNQEVIRIPESPYDRKTPQLIGFLGQIGETGYIDSSTTCLCIWIDSNTPDSPEPDDIFKGLGIVEPQDGSQISENGSVLVSFNMLDGNGDRYEHSSFQIFNEDESIELPLRRTFEPSVYFDCYEFSEYRPCINNEDEWDNYSSEGYDDHWSCDACDGNSETGCMSTTGNCYR